MHEYNVIFGGSNIEVPNTEFLIIPSAKYYYLNKDNIRIPFPSSEIEDKKILYSMKKKEIFSLDTAFAKANPIQIGWPYKIKNGPADEAYSILANSLKGYLRQYTDDSSYLYFDQFHMITMLTKTGFLETMSQSQFMTDLYLFPPNPASDIFLSSRLFDNYLTAGDEEPLRDYLHNCGVTHLDNHSFNYYPVYYLFFLLTRFYSYPLTENQIKLSIERNKYPFNSNEHKFIDCIFNYNIDIKEILNMLKDLKNTELKLGTTNEDWVRWADEYIFKPQKIDIKNFNIPSLDIADKLYTWTDIEVEELLKKLDIIPPFRSEFITRYEYIYAIAVKVYIKINNYVEKY